MDGVFSWKSYLFLVIFSSWEIVSAARIEITPVKYEGLVTTAVNITCELDKEEINQEMVMIQIVRGETQMASVRQGSKIQYGNDFTSVVEAEGCIEPGVRNSFLRLTMRYMMEANSGKYTCLVYYINDKGFMEEERDSGDLIVDDPDIKSHLKYLIQQKFLQDDLLKSLTKRIKDLENKATKTVDIFSALETVVSNHTYHINHLEIKDSYVSSFTAGYVTKGPLKVGNVVIYDKHVMSQGQGYDKTTGLFTAPTTGIYVFHLTAMTHANGHYLQLEIQVNNNGIARTLSRDSKHWDQSTISCVVKLEPGDVVRVIVKHVSSNASIMHNYPFSLFAGYLLKVL